MTAEVYWVRDIEPLKLAIMPRPRGGEWLEDEVASWKQSGISTVVNLLHRYEIEELCISNEEAFCKSSGIEYRSFPIQDRGTPRSVPDFLALTDNLSSQIKSGRSVAIHCRAGIGRSGIAAASVLVKLGVSASETFAMLSRARGLAVPDTSEQVAWFQSLAKRNAIAL